MDFTRFREKDHRTLHEFVRNDFDNEGNPYGVQPAYVSKTMMGSTKSIADNNHAGYSQRIARGEVILGDVLLNEWSLEGSAVSTEVSFPGGLVHRYSGSIAPVVLGNISELCSLDAEIANGQMECLVKAYAKMNSSPLLSGESLSELGKTLGMLKRPFSGAQDLCLRMIKAKKRATRKTTMSAMKAAEGAWLEGRYGMTPLILDASTIMQEARKSSVNKESRRVVARSGMKLEKIESVHRAGVVSNMLYATTCSVTQKRSCGIGAGVIFSVKNRKGLELAVKTAGLDLRSLPATLYEKLPLSFVVDWFIGVGPWLQAVIPDRNVTVEGNWTSVNSVSNHYVFNIITDQLYWAYWLGQYIRLYGQFGNVSLTQRTYQRVTNVNLPSTPVLRGGDLSLLHTVDGVALLTQSILGYLRELKH